MIFSNNLFKNLSFQQNPLKKPVAKWSSSDFNCHVHMKTLLNDCPCTFFMITWHDFNVYKMLIYRSCHQRCSIKKVFLKISQNSEGIEESLAQVFFGEFYEFLKNTFFTEHLWVNASRFSFKDGPPKTSDESST